MVLHRGGKWLVLFWLAALLLVLSGTSGSAQADSTDHDTFQPPKSLEAAHVPGEVLVKFKDSPATFRGKSSRKHYLSVQGAAAAEFAAALPPRAQASLERVQGRVVRAHPSIGVLRVKLPDDVSVSQAIESLYRSGTVEYAEPNGLIVPQATPDDPQFANQWGLPAIKAPNAWDIIIGGNTIVAVVDTGVDYKHEDLVANMWVNTGEWAGLPGNFVANQIDEDGNLFVDDYYGINTAVTPSTGDPLDTFGHGTGMAGIIGAAGNNGTGMAGINWQTKIMALKCMTGTTGTVDNATTCINYALAKRGTAPLVITLGWKQQTNTYYNAFRDSLKGAQDAGALIVAAAGNDGEDNDIIPNYPSAYNHDAMAFSPTSVTADNIISVGGSDQADKKEANSSYGMATVDIFAPGKDIVTTLYGSPENKYGLGTGTSFAAAHVAGACALLWNKYPNKDWKQIKALILNGAEDGVAPNDLRTICVTEGRLNLANSLSPAIENAPAVFSIFEVSPNSGDPAVIAARADTGDTLVITGVNFGGTPGVLTFLDTTFPAGNILTWSDEKITATVPADLPKGVGRLLVTNAAGLTSRGACFSNISREKLVGNLLLARGMAASAQVGNNVWIIGGRTYWGTVPHVEKYSLDTKRAVSDSQWMMPTPVSNAGAASIGSKIYVVGGATENSAGNFIPMANLQIFDTNTLTWEDGPPLPKALMQCAVTSLGGKLYAFGGLKSSGTSSYAAANDTSVFDPGTNSWSTLTVLPTAAAYAAVAPTASGKIWVMGGFSSSTNTSQLRLVQEYDPALNRWTAQPHLIRPRGGAAGINFAGLVYSLRGTKPYIQNTSIYDEYADGEWYNANWDYWMPSIMNYLGIWVSPPNVLARSGLYTPSPGKYLDKIFLLGGVTGTDSTYKYSYSNKVWAFPAPGGGTESASRKGLHWLPLLLGED
jgi:subtilisin family serine protease